MKEFVSIDDYFKDRPWLMVEPVLAVTLLVTLLVTLISSKGSNDIKLLYYY